MTLGHHKRVGDDETSVTLKGKSLSFVTESKLLGVVVDSNLSWCSHINYIVSKVSPKIGLLGRLRFSLPSNLLTVVYNSIIVPYFDYCDTVWGNCCQKYKNILQRLQNRCARIVSGNFDYTVSPKLIIEELGWQQLEERRRFHLATLTYKCLNSAAPQYLANKFTFCNQIHQRNTRSHKNQNLYVPRPRTEKFKQSLSFIGAKTWNMLPTEVRSADSVHVFKNRYKGYISNPYNKCK